MSSNSGGSHLGGSNEDIEADESTRDKNSRPDEQPEESIKRGEAHEEMIDNEAFESGERFAEDGPQDDQQVWEEELAQNNDYPHLSREAIYVVDEGPSRWRAYDTFG